MNNNTNTQQKVYTRTLEQTKERLAMVQQQEKDFNRELSDNYKQMRQLELKKRRVVKKISSHMKYITQLEEEVKSKQQHTIEGGKGFKIKSFYETIGMDLSEVGYKFDFVGGLSMPYEKNEAVKSAIEKTLNNEVDNPVLERQGMSINNISDLYNNGRFTTMTDQPQEVKEPNKDWEVLEVVDFRRGVIKVGEGTLFNYVDGEPIHSVRRISDGEVLTAMDGNYGSTERADGYPNKPIKKFFEKDGLMYAQFNEGRGNNDGCLPITYIRKLPPQIAEQPKQVLFTTEDGVNIYHDTDLLWRVFIEPSSYECWKPYEMFAPNYEVEGEKYFSTRQVADSWILMNKPCLSVKDIEDYFGTWAVKPTDYTKENIKQLANNKINKQ